MVQIPSLSDTWLCQVRALRQIITPTSVTADASLFSSFQWHISLTYGQLRLALEAILDKLNLPKNYVTKHNYNEINL